MNRILSLQRMQAAIKGPGELMQSKTSCIQHSCSGGHNR